ncbi:extracellular serine proteinase-like [Patiria miniata]|uniref:Peptidase S8/S53 domain-containing protein n=1 Tax=Patiria miniata TaxID=46514 RepID=A0A914BME2_PATMI|nr:extracellular serine proteinase-like [Patiria miniata]
MTMTITTSIARQSEMFHNYVAGLDWVLQNKVSPCVVVLALSTGGSQVLDEAVKTLHDAGCVVVAAAGRSSEQAKTERSWPVLGWSRGLRAPLPVATSAPGPTPEAGMDDFLHEACRRSPARSPYVMTVAASDSVDAAPSWSNTGLCVDLFAPGQDIYTVNFKNDDDYLYASGTAMATAYVAGAAAIHLADGVMEAPDTLPSQLVNELIRMRILKDASTCNVMEAGEGTPNRLLYIM